MTSYCSIMSAVFPLLFVVFKHLKRKHASVVSWPPHLCRLVPVCSYLLRFELTMFAMLCQHGVHSSEACNCWLALTCQHREVFPTAVLL